MTTDKVVIVGSADDLKGELIGIPHKINIGLKESVHVSPGNTLTLQGSDTGLLVLT